MYTTKVKNSKRSLISLLDGILFKYLTSYKNSSFFYKSGLWFVSRDENQIFQTQTNVEQN